MIKLLKQTFGLPLAALLIGAAVFMIPKIVHDDYVFIKSWFVEVNK